MQITIEDLREKTDTFKMLLDNTPLKKANLTSKD